MGRIVAIVGRPNVGKSTLFNRLVGERKAIVDDMSGVTRDRHYGKAEWIGYEFTVIDTGGYVQHSDDVFESAIRDQVKIAIEEADVMLFMVDVTTGITDLDSDFAALLRKSKKPALVVANKVDNNERIVDTAEFYSFGLGEVFPLCSISGAGTGELLDEVVERLRALPPTAAEETLTDVPKVAIVGKPNVGKSSLVNALLGEDRNIVTPIAGTTRDTIHTHYKAYGHEYLLIDTAGIRKKGKVTEDIEFYSVIRAIKAIEECDVCVLLIDATQGIESQDLNLFHQAEKNGKGIVVLVNKWDLMEKETNSAKTYEETIKRKTAPFTDYPVLFVSALEKQRIYKAMETIGAVYTNLSKKINTHQLNEVMLPIILATPPPAYKGKYIKIKYITQLRTKVPSFAFFCNLPQYFKDPYKRFLENKLRENFDFSGTPLRIFFRKK
ncbi:MAG: ribosome biogenesis GTPase Der [Bacteroidetes bacterium]|nr:MAG: ribosome biogenesis GTPase Der [Bacteroidota bacterium]